MNFIFSVPAWRRAFGASLLGLLLTAPALAAPADPPPGGGHLRPERPAGFRSGPYQRVDPHSRIAGDFQRLYLAWRGKGGKAISATTIRAAFPDLLLSADGHRALVRITLRDAAALKTPLAARGFELVSAQPRHHFVEGWLPIGQLAPGEAGLSQLASQGLLGVLPVYRPHTNGGLTTNQADYVHEAARVRASAGHFDGTGVRVGVMSDSYDALTGGAAAGVASGDLPVAGVQVLQDLTASDGGTDEGRAMCELIHDVAPGAPLAFSSVFLGEGNFADQVRALADPARGNCRVLTDDIWYHSDPMFQDGVIGQAIDQVVTTRGVTYFSSAGNFADNAVELVAPTAVPGPGGAALLDFDPGPGTDPRQHFTLNAAAGGYVELFLQWSDPYYTTTGVQTDLDLYLLDAAGDTVASATDDNQLTQTPFEYLAYYPEASQASTSYELLLVRRTGTINPARVKYIGGFSTRADEYAPGTGALWGHRAATHAQAVAATPFYNRFAPEDFTAKGSVVILFDSLGAPLPTAQPRAKPNLTAVDGTATTFFYQQLNTTPTYFFFGTSAAAPNAAAVAALLRQAEPALPPAQVYARLAATATDLLAPGFDDLTGAGLINAYAAIFGLAAPVAPTSAGFFADLDGAAARAWEIGGNGNARAQIRGDLGPASGRGALVLDAGHFGAAYAGGTPPLANNATTLHLDLSGTPPAGGWALTFRHKKLPGETDNSLPATYAASRTGDAVGLSVDGGQNWKRLVQLTGAGGSTTTWQTATINLTQFAQTNSLTLGADVRIRFQQAGAGMADTTYGAPGGGRVFDDVRVAPANAAAQVLFNSSWPLRGCPGLTVQYQDASLNVPAGATYAWTFPGGTPASSTLPNPAVTYATPGHYAVTLAVTGGGATATRQDTGYVFIYGRRPVVAFGSTGTQLICPGGQVQFNSDVQYCPTGLTWSFPGGSPTTSTTATPLVTYATPGTYAVTLTATNAFGTGSASQTNYVVATSGTPLPTAEGFSSGLPVQWTIDNPDRGITWQVADSVVSADGSRGGAMVMPMFLYSAPGRRDALVSAPVDLTGQPRAVVRFDVAYQPLVATLPGGPFDDTLAVEVVEFCSLTRLGRVYMSHALGTLGTAPPAANIITPFAPTRAADWRRDGADLTPYVGQKVVLRFLTINGWGNDLYLDNITLNDQPLGLGADHAPAPELAVWPNPVAAGAPLHVRLPAAGPATVRLLDALGREVWGSTGPAAPDQPLTLTAPLVPGLYTLRTVPAWLSYSPGAGQAGAQQRVQVVPAAYQTRSVVVR